MPLIFGTNKQLKERKKDMASLFLEERHFIFPPYSMIMLACFLLLNRKKQHKKMITYTSMECENSLGKKNIEREDK